MLLEAEVLFNSKKRFLNEFIIYSFNIHLLKNSDFINKK